MHIGTVSSKIAILLIMCNRSVFGYVSLGGCQAKSSQTDRHKVTELVDDGYKIRFRHTQVRSTGIRACGNKNHD